MLTDMVCPFQNAYVNMNVKVTRLDFGRSQYQII